MEPAVDFDRLHRVLADHPWLADALRAADWWSHEDGSITFRARIDAPEGKLPALAELAAALGCELNRSSDATEPWPLPDEPAIRLEDLPPSGRPET